jgi:plastocyanin
MRNSIVPLALAVTLAACGGGDDAGSPTAGASTSGAPSSAPASAPVALEGTVNDKGTGNVGDDGSLELELDDSYFAPTFVKGKPGATITVTLENEGAMPHTFTIDAPKVDVTVQPDTKGTAKVTLPASGALAFYCKFHKTQGMQGAFFDKEGATVAGGSGGSGEGYQK